MRRRRSYYVGFGILILLFLLVMPVGTLFLPKGKSFYYLLAAQKMLKKGDIEGAISQTKKAVELQPKSIIAVRGLARAYIAAGKYREAEKTVENLIAMAPDLPEAYYDLGVVRFQAGDMEGSREAAEKALSLSPESGDNYHLLGAIALNKEDMEAAEKYLKQSIALDGQNLNSHYLLGLVYFEKKQFSDAVDELQIVENSRPDLAECHALIGLCFLEQKLYVHAMSELKAAVDLDPTDYTSMYNIACVYSLQNRPEPALKWLERSIDKGFSNFDHMRKDSDLDNIRNNPRYIELVKRNSSKAPAGKAGAKAQTPKAK